MKILIKIIAFIISILIFSSISYAGGEISLSNKVKINEIHPNPDGKDEGNEWIELYNNSERSIDLNGWKIATHKNIFPLNSKIIAGKDYLIISDKKLPLRNDEDEIKLIDPQNNIIDNVYYKNIKEGFSFALIEIKKKKILKKTWDIVSPTQKSRNQIFYEFEGKIKVEPYISEEYIFEIKTSDKEHLKIIIDEEKFNLEVLKTILPKGTSIKILTSKINKEVFLMKEFQIMGEIQTSKKNLQKQNLEYLLIIPIAILSAALICLSYAKISKNPYN